jgi:hypothetical protein
LHQAALSLVKEQLGELQRAQRADQSNKRSRPVAKKIRALGNSVQQGGDEAEGGSDSGHRLGGQDELSSDNEVSEDEANGHKRFSEGERAGDEEASADAIEVDAADSEATIASHRLQLHAEESVYAAKQRSLDVTSLEAYLAASTAVERLTEDAAKLRATAEASAKRVCAIQEERSRKLLRGLELIDSGLRATFRSLCKHGDCILEYARQ